MDQILDSHQMQGMPPAYAGFWTRFAAFFIDGILIGIVQAILSGITLGTLTIRDSSSIEGLGSRVAILYLLVISIQWLYSALMESSANQATLGKMAMGIKVTDEQGNRINFAKATGRYFSKIISSLILTV